MSAWIGNAHKLGPDDYQQWRLLREASRAEQGVPPERLGSNQDTYKSYVNFGIWMDGELVGYVALLDPRLIIQEHCRATGDTVKDPPRYGVADLYVRPEFRQQGMANALMEHALRYVEHESGPVIGVSLPVQALAWDILERRLRGWRVIAFAGEMVFTDGPLELAVEHNNRLRRMMRRAHLHTQGMAEEG